MEILRYIEIELPREQPGQNACFICQDRLGDKRERNSRDEAVCVCAGHYADWLNTHRA